MIDPSPLQPSAGQPGWDAHAAAALLLAAVLAVGTGLAGQAGNGPPFPAAPSPAPTAAPGERPGAAPPPALRADAGRYRTPKPPPGGRLDLNRADLEALIALPGIGETLARRIVEFRAAYGPFRSPEDLLQVPGMGSKRLERIRPFVQVVEGP